MYLALYSQRFLSKKTLPQFEAHLVKGIKESVFYRPIKNLPADFQEEDKTHLAQAYSKVIEEQIMPTYKKHHDFIKDEYLPKCRDTIGLTELPDGGKWYAYNVKRSTTTNMTPEEIFQTGMSEVMRIKKEMEEIKERVGFKGDLQAFFEYLRTDDKFYYTSEKDLLKGLDKLWEKIDTELPRLFGLIPKANYEIRPIEEFRKKSAAAAHYRGPTPRWFQTRHLLCEYL